MCDLQTDFEFTAIWRREKAVEFPDDPWSGERATARAKAHEFATEKANEVADEAARESPPLLRDKAHHDAFLSAYDNAYSIKYAQVLERLTAKAA